MKILTAPQSGSQAGTTASRNRFGQYLRSRAMPVQPRTPKQTANRAVFTAASSAWRSLSKPDQDAWNTYAGQISRSDSLGQTYTPTGAELFVGGSIAIGSGSYSGGPPTVLPTYVLQVLSVTYTDPTPGPEALDVDIVNTSANNQMTVETSGPVSPGVTSAAAVRNWLSLPSDALNTFRQGFALTATPVSILAAYNFLFPSPVSGQNIWFRFTEYFADGVNAIYILNRSRQTYRLVIP